MNFRQVRPKKIYEEVATQIEAMIEKKQLKPGEKLPSVQALAEQFKVGRSAVREALSALQAKGFVEMRQGEGTFVSTYDGSALGQAIRTAVLMDPEQIRELLEVRKSLEVGAAGLAAVRRTEGQLAEMARELTVMREQLDCDAAGEQADVRFHLAIARASGNALLNDLMHTVAGAMSQTIRDSRRLWLYSDASSAEQLLKEHEAIYEAIKNQQPETAEKRMFRHLDKVIQTVYRLMKEGKG